MTLGLHETYTPHPYVDFLEVVDARRMVAFEQIPADERSKMGQFGTPLQVARLMARMFNFDEPEVRLLDAGAGIGSLSAAFVDAACRVAQPPKSISITAYEIDRRLHGALSDTLDDCKARCEDRGIRYHHNVIAEDFVESVVSAHTDMFSASDVGGFNCAIQNPPYKKVRSASRHRQLLRKIGIEATNLYAAFVALTTRLLEPGGQLVAITPRSFCNGPYFKDFRRDFLRRMRVERLHLFGSRTDAFSGDSVLQENIVVAAKVGAGNNSEVLITSSNGADEGDELQRRVPHDLVVPPGSAAPFIHLITDGSAEAVADRMGRFKSSLVEIGIKVSTGRVVDFRAKPLLRSEPAVGDFPLIYPANLKDGTIEWPVAGKKPQALKDLDGVQKLLVPPGRYVVIKRFSSKEQRRRIEASIYDSADVAPSTSVGFENHVNYIHDNGEGLGASLALGLATYLNSSLTDLYFRLFSGHTQVNATDLRAFPFPTADELRALGHAAGRVGLSQEETDDALSSTLLGNQPEEGDPVAQKKRVEEAQDVLKQLGLPKAQQNERSALVLLALLGLQSTTEWKDLTRPMMGITPMMDWFADEYGKRYAPNSRETVRRQTIHQFLEAGLVVQNPDDPSRPTNSGKTVYQIGEEVAALLKTYGTKKWLADRTVFITQHKTLKEKYKKPRQMARIDVTIDGDELSLSPGGQNVLVEQIINEFLPRFAPGCEVVYVGDTEDKWAHFQADKFEALGVEVESHGKFPDVVAHYTKKNWLLLIEAVTSHGPVDAKRHAELSDLFKGCSAGIVYVTTFLNRKDFGKYLGEIAWETEVWVAESPSHMIHFDGKRFLGPYAD